MMTPRQIEGLQKWLPTLGTFLAIGIAWGVLTAQVSGKAEMSDVQVLRYEIESQSRKLDALVRMACRADPKDSICPYQ